MMTRSKALVRRVGAYGSSGALVTRIAGSIIRNSPRILSAAKNYVKQRGTSQKKSITPSVISTQYDVGNRYSRKSMPRYKRRKWKGFTNRVKHVMLQMNPLNTFTNDNYRRVITWVAEAQATFGQMLGGVSATDNDEILGAFKAAYGGALSTTTVDRYKLFIKSMCLDIQIKNTGANTAVLDVYQLICRKGDRDSNRIETSYSNAFAEQDVAAIGTVTSTNTATTPFQNPLFLSMWKILNKKEILLGSGQTTTMQMRIPYNRMMYGKLLENNLQAIAGLTRAYLFQVRGAPVNSAGSGSCAAGELVICAQTTVAYALPPGDINVHTGQV